ncbi:hypothetical protein [Telmatospirillum siberiense]|uniref:Uncharacterized protein n=1 Tax=Telmatospirillum siberiense TaxID=382514 RepID=A0A2N3PMU5_9PROT|nr:hypothetical protein [Telmatospirillum siberiense]PKU21722.1 hypothetical protein CWS72_25410 [Telmatospirillum siberiense]
MTDNVQRLRILSAALAVVVIIGVVARDVTSLAWGRDAARAALLAFVAIEARAVVRGGRIMLAVCLTSALAAWIWQPDPLSLLGRALDDGAFIVGLFAALSLLRDAAESSHLVQTCGGWMVRQPPGRRYLVLSVGSHLISLVLNFGVLPLLGTMVLKGNTLEAAGGDVRVTAIRQQRMMTAVLRGYCMMTVWSPLSICFAVTQVSVPGIAWWRLLPLQLGLAVLLMGLGWVMDRRAFPGTQAPRGAEQAGGHRPMYALGILIGAVVTCSVAWAETLGVRPVIGAMMVVPVSALIWLTAQHWSAQPQAAVAMAFRRLGQRLTVSMPSYRNEFVILGGAMFFGRLASAFLSPEITAKIIGLVPLPPVAVSVLLAWAMMLLANFGVPQIVTVTLLGSAVTNLTRLGIDPLVLASGLMGAWSLSATTTPVGAAALTVARLSGVSSTTVAHEWNGAFVRMGAILIALWMLALSLFL